MNQEDLAMSIKVVLNVVMMPLEVNHRHVVPSFVHFQIHPVDIFDLDQLILLIENLDRSFDCKENEVKTFVTGMIEDGEDDDVNDDAADDDVQRKRRKMLMKVEVEVEVEDLAVDVEVGMRMDSQIVEQLLILVDPGDIPYKMN